MTSACVSQPHRPGAHRGSVEWCGAATCCELPSLSKGQVIVSRPASNAGSCSKVPAHHQHGGQDLRASRMDTLVRAGQPRPRSAEAMPVERDQLRDDGDVLWA